MEVKIPAAPQPLRRLPGAIFHRGRKWCRTHVQRSGSRLESATPLRSGREEWASRVNEPPGNQPGRNRRQTRPVEVCKSIEPVSFCPLACASSRNHILETIEKQKPYQGGGVNAVFREWQSAVRSYPGENVLRLAHFW